MRVPTRRRISKKLRKHVQSEISTSVQVGLITLRHESLEVPIRASTDPTQRVAQTAENIIYGTVSRGNIYYYTGFEYSLPNDEDGAPPQVNIRLPIVTRDVIEAIEKMTTGIVKVDLEIVFADSPDIVEIGLYDLELADINYDLTSVSGTISRDLLFQEPYPCNSFIPQHYPFLFAKRN